MAHAVLAASVSLACGSERQAVGSSSRGQTSQAPASDTLVRDTSTGGVRPASGSSTGQIVTAAAPSDMPPCGDALRVALLARDAGAGQRHVSFTLTNGRSTRCAVVGRPQVAVRAAEAPTPLIVSEPVPGATEVDTVVALAPGMQAVFAIGYVGIPADGRPCVHADTVVITPPAATHATAIPIPMTVCVAPRVHVTPVMGGAAAAAGSYVDTLPAADAPAPGRVVTLRLDTDGGAELDTAFLDGAQAAARRGRWSLRDTILDVRFPDAAPLRWMTRDGQLVPLTWDRQVYGRAGLRLRRQS